MEFDNKACYKTSTYNQKQQYQIHTSFIANSGLERTLLHQDVVNAFMVVDIAIITVNSILFLAM